MSQPTRLGRYPVRRRLGAGAFATVWLAHDEELDSPVAIKVLADNWAGDAHVRRRFVEEGRFLRKVESPHVVGVYDAGELDDGRPFLVMAYADRGTLAERLVEGPVPRSEALRVLTEVGAGLQALHVRGVLHRDVKPGNVLLRSHDGEVRAMLADLGLGKELDVSSRLTVIAGTPSYVAPEQARGEALDARADLFSLAALAYLLLAGRPAWSHQSLSLAADPPTVTAMGGDVPAAVERVVLRGLSSDRKDRQESVAAFVADLLEAAGHQPESAVAAVGAVRAEPTTLEEPRADGAPSRSRLARTLLLAALAVLLGVGGGWWLAGRVTGDVRLTDADGALAVTVPDAWAESVQDRGWRPPEADGVFPALAAGTGADWREEGEGVFVALYEGNDLPGDVPGHAECGSRRVAPESLAADAEARPSLTVVHSDCPAPARVVVERVEQVAADRLLWVQVRSADREVAEQVLASVEVPGV